MLDIIKELLPLLEGAKNGAIWMVAAYFGIIVLEMLLWFTFFLFLIISLARLIKFLNGGDGVTRDNWNLLQWDGVRDGRKMNACFHKRALKELLEEVAYENGDIHDSNLARAVKIIRGANEK